MVEIDLVMVGSIHRQNHARLDVSVIIERHSPWDPKGADANVPRDERGEKKGVMRMGIGVIRSRDCRSCKVPYGPYNNQ